MMSLAASGETRAPFVKLASVLKGDCDCPLPLDPLFLTYQTRLLRLRVAVPVVIDGPEDPAPVLLKAVYVKVSEARALAVTGGVYLKVPSEAIVTLPPWVVAKVPPITVTFPAGVSLAKSVAARETKGVAGDVV